MPGAYPSAGASGAPLTLAETTTPTGVRGGYEDEEGSGVAGVGALAFAVLLFVAALVADPPGGTYELSNVTDYVAKGHRASVFVSLYLVLLGVVGLVCLLARLRDAIGGHGRIASIFWATGVASAAAFANGHTLVTAVPLAMAYGGKEVTVAPTITYTIAEAGWAIMYGGVLLECALVILALTPVALPSWVRWSTLVAGIAGLAAPAWFPFFLVLIWSLVIGIWLLVADRGRVAAGSEAQPA